MNIASQMAAVIDHWRPTAVTVPSHQSHQLAGHPVAWWFSTQNASTVEFMRALASDSAYVTPGNPETSRLFKTFLRADRPMGRTLAADVAVIRQWIQDGAPTDLAPIAPGDLLPKPNPATAVALPTTEEEKQAFHKLVNIEDFPEFLPRAKEIAKAYLANVSYTERLHAEFEYTENALDVRMAEIYDEYLRDMYTPSLLDTGLFKRIAAIDSKVLAEIEVAHIADLNENRLTPEIRAVFAAAGVGLSDKASLSTQDPGLWWAVSDGDDKAYMLYRKDKVQVFHGGARDYSVGRFSDASVKYGLLQRAPFNLTDGAWLRNIVSASPVDAVQSRLFDIWADEAGNGEVEQNHPNVYLDLLHSVGYYVPAITSTEFLTLDFIPDAFRSSVFQLSIGQFPQEFYPELIGMTLLLEWEATPTLTPTVLMLRGRRINPLFYQLHVAIDNISEGHGAKAKEAVKIYLSKAREDGGDALVQSLWKRIWSGYVGWATVGFAGAQIFKERMQLDRKSINIGTSDMRICWPSIKSYFADRMVKMIERKAPVASQVHGSRTLGGVSLNSLFARPRELMNALVRTGYANPDSPRDSRLIQLMQFEGPMYRVFSEEDQDILLDWIESLREGEESCIDPLPPAGTEDPLPKQMFDLIVAKAPVAKRAHDGIMLRGADGSSTALADLFDDPRKLMSDLVGNGWVVPGEPGRSMLWSRVIQNGGPMNSVFSAQEAAVIEKWIAAGAKLPDDKRADVKTAKPRIVKTLSLSQKRPYIGMGNDH